MNKTRSKVMIMANSLVKHGMSRRTQNIYSHILQEAQNRNAEIIGSAMFQKKKPLSDDENGSGKKTI
ncbi:MAG: hypothetical protein ACI4JK_12880 [Oscillospiraceae bacterium]